MFKEMLSDKVHLFCLACICLTWYNYTRSKIGENRVVAGNACKWYSDVIKSGLKRHTIMHAAKYKILRMCYVVHDMILVSSV